MARADLVLGLADASLKGEVDRVRKFVEVLSAEERSKRHTVLADQLSDLLAMPARRAPVSFVVADSRIDGLVEVAPKRRIADLSLPAAVEEELQSLIEEQHRAELLRAYNLEPRHKVLLVGPPGNGKTSTAEALATELAVPLLILNYETVITSFLGETSAKLAAVMGHASTRHCVLFIDEFDTLAKERGDEHDSGEIKRVVSTLLLQIDRLPSHVVVCAATNHGELLDRAVWRRFEVRLDLPNPTKAGRVRFLGDLFKRLGVRPTRSLDAIAERIGPKSYAELEDIILTVRRRQLIAGDYSGADDAHLARVLRNNQRSAKKLLDAGGQE